MKSALISVAVLFFVVHWAFVAVMHAKVYRDDLTLYWKVVLWPLVAILAVLDAVFNLALGWLIYLESPIPREMLFTTRCQRHLDESDGWRLKVALWWKRQLNIFDKRHLKYRRLP